MKFCKSAITQSRINTGLIAIPRTFSSMFPEFDTDISLILDDAHAPVRKKFTTHTGKSNETRIYGLAAWYADNNVHPGDKIFIELLSPLKNLYRLRILKIDAGNSQTENKDFVQSCDVESPPKRIKAVVNRIIRDTPKARKLKQLHEHRCQVCGGRLVLSNGFYYSEVHHIRPLGAPHLGSDDYKNMLVVCPNHHTLFDYWVPRFVSSGKIMLYNEEIALITKHHLCPSIIDYYNCLWRCPQVA